MAIYNGTVNADRFVCTSGADLVTSGDGPDVIFAYALPPRSFGFAGYNLMMADQADVVDAGNGDDVIHTGAGNDVIVAGAGNDRLVGGTGADSLTGGADADVFVFGRPGGPMLEQDCYTGAQADTVMDFERGVDKIDLRGLCSTASPGGFWLGTTDAVATTTQLQVGYRVEGGNTVVEGWQCQGAGASPALMFEVVLGGFVPEGRFGGLGPQDFLFS